MNGMWSDDQPMMERAEWRDSGMMLRKKIPAGH